MRFRSFVASSSRKSTKHKTYFLLDVKCKIDQRTHGFYIVLIIITQREEMSLLTFFTTHELVNCSFVLNAQTIRQLHYCITHYVSKERRLFRIVVATCSPRTSKRDSCRRCDSSRKKKTVELSLNVIQCQSLPEARKQ